MKKLLIALLTLMSSFSVVFTACKNEDTHTNNGNSVNSSTDSSSNNNVDKTPDSSTDSSSNSNVDKTPDSSTDSSSNANEEIQRFSLSTNIENCTITSTTIQFSVSWDTYSYSFIHSFNIPTNYKWELHYDKSCFPNLNVVSKTADLTAGENTLYALFVNKNDAEEIYLYEIHIYKEYRSAVGTYSRSGYTLNFYSDGTLFLSYNGEYMDIEGTWTQSENTICYSVWNVDGFEWNNPFYNTVYDDGIDFLGDYYKLVENNS